MYPNSINTHHTSYSESHYRSSSTSSKDPRQQPMATQEAEKSPPPSKADNFDVSALVKTIWDFAEARISTAKAEGASEAELESMWKAAEKGVSQGFGEAKDILDDMGLLDEQLSMKVDAAYGKLMDTLGERNLSAEPAVAETRAPHSAEASNRTVEIHQYERQTFKLNLRTLDGDKIQIRSVAENISTLEDKKFGHESSTVWGNKQTSGYQLIIKGDLNDQERADLDALLADVNELAYEFYEGDYETAFNMAQDLNIDGTSLKSMKLSMKEVEQKSASVYSELDDRPTVLPKGLTSLREYAEKLVSSQAEWEKHFNAPESFLDSLSNHPKNHGQMEHMARLLMA